MSEEKPNEKKVSIAGTIEEAGNSVANKTGSWRTFKPNVTDRCTGCSICTWYCPENCIAIAEEGGKKKAVINYDYCKGCMICSEVCPMKAVEKEKE